jgi:SAM-dependent methyltransferase
MLLNVVRLLVHIVLPTRKPLYKYLNSIESNYKNLDILEIGSGDVRKNQSAVHIFSNSNSFIQTDINSELGHKFLDITGEIQIEEKYDLVLCTNVLEHVYDTNLAIKNLKYLMKEKGHLVISVPFIYPLHDEPEDYWRFTEHAIKQLFSDFKILTLKRTGIRQFPIQYILLLEKNT